MDKEYICPSCATPIELPATMLEAFLVCPNCGIPIDVDEDGITKDDYL